MVERDRGDYCHADCVNDVPQEKKTHKKKRNPGGRPSSFKPEYVAQVRKLCEFGATDVEIADFFGISDRTVYRWQIEYPEFCQALKAGKEAVDDRIERSLLHRASGYSHEAVKIFMPAGASDPVYAPYREHFPPDTTAAIFWLKNRRPDVWRDKTINEHTGKDGAPIKVEDVTDKQRARALASFVARTKVKQQQG